MGPMRGIFRLGYLGGLFSVLVLGRTVMAHRNSAMNLKANNDGESVLAENDDVNSKWQCKPQSPTELKEGLNDYQLRGVNLGSWMVLEPWITPSMFFQFIGKQVFAGGSGKSDVGMDTYSFCAALGPEEGNKQLRRHWATWVMESDISQLASLGINTVRLPVGDWMYKPYGPYVGCTDGALDEVDRLFSLCRRYGIHVLLDIHALSGSQNGFDNSGESMDVEWTTYSSTRVSSAATFAHWPYRAARWIGDWDRETGSYTSKNETAIQHTLSVIQTMVDLYSNETVVVGLQPVNEPWQFTPVDWLKDFYWKGYHIVRKDAPHWLYLMHDSFNFDVNTWGTFMKNCPTIGLDTHIYQAWSPPGAQATYLSNACEIGDAIVTMEEKGMPVIVGEWSLATDNCAMWLNGWQDNLPGFPQVQCKMVPCPLPYMGSDQPGAPPSLNMPPTGPFGTGSSTPSYGMCPIDAPWHSEDEFMTSLASAKLHSFEQGHGWFFWNFKTELEVRWDYMAATEKGYFPFHADELDNNEDVIRACDRFNGRVPAKGMPPGVYKEGDHTSPDGTSDVRRGSSVVLSCILLAFMGVIAAGVVKFFNVRRRLQGGGWQALENGHKATVQGQFSPAILGGYQAEHIQATSLGLN